MTASTAISPSVTFGGQTGSIALSLLDTNFTQIATFLNNANNYSNYLVDTGAANAIVVATPSGTTATYTAGLFLVVKVIAANTGATTINVNSLGTKNVYYPNITALNANSLLTGGLSLLIYDGTQFILMGTLAGQAVNALSFTATASITGSVNQGPFNYGTLTFSDSGIFQSMQTSLNGYTQFSIQNSNSGAAASSEYIAYNNNGTATTNYVTMGINSSGYTGTGSLNAAGYGFITTASTDLVIGTTGNNPIHFVVNSGATDAMTIDTANSLNLGGAYTEGVVAIGNSSTSKTLSLASGTFQTVTMTGNCTFTMPTNVAGKSFILIVSTGAGGFTGTFTSVKWPSNTAPTLTTTASRWDILTFFADGTNWYGTYAQAFQ